MFFVEMLRLKPSCSTDSFNLLDINSGFNIEADKEQ